MEIAVTVLSIAVQFFAAILALRIAITVASWRLAWLPMALSVLLMGIRRSFSLYNKLAFERAIDIGAETIALTISALMWSV
jgi:hypothetical protein